MKVKTSRTFGNLMSEDEMWDDLRERNEQLKDINKREHVEQPVEKGD